MVESGTFIKLNEKLWPGCFYARQRPARCGPGGGQDVHLLALARGRGPDEQLDESVRYAPEAPGDFQRAMRGRTMYVLPFSMGPVGSPMAQIGVQLTDSPYVVANMRIMARIGLPVYKEIDKAEKRVVPCVHSVGAPLEKGREGRAVAVQQGEVHRALPRGPGDLELRLRIRRQRAAGQEMLRAADRLQHRARRGLDGGAHADPGRENPQGEKTYVAAAFPSACGKTNFAMMIPPKALRRGLEGLDAGR